MNTWLARIAVVLAITVTTSVLAGCAGVMVYQGKYQSVKITQTNDSPGMKLRYDFGPYPVIEKGVANACIETQTSVSGRQNLCRVVDGVEGNGVGDHRSWLLEFTVLGGQPGGAPFQMSGDVSGADRYGAVLVMDNGVVYEGCVLLAWTKAMNNYWCDFRSRKHIVQNVSSGSWNYVLRKLWNWTKYVGNTAGCAGGIAGVLAGTGKITFPLLTGCVDGPI